MCDARRSIGVSSPPNQVLQNRRLTWGVSSQPFVVLLPDPASVFLVTGVSGNGMISNDGLNHHSSTPLAHHVTQTEERTKLCTV